MFLSGGRQGSRNPLSGGRVERCFGLLSIVWRTMGYGRWRRRVRGVGLEMHMADDEGDGGGDGVESRDGWGWPGR